MKTSTVVLILGLAAAGGVGFYLYKKSQAPASSGGSLWSGIGDVIKGVGGIADAWAKQSSGHEPDPANTTRIRGPLIGGGAARAVV